MLKKILLPTIFLLLGYGFWISPELKNIAAGDAVFLFGMLALPSEASAEKLATALLATLDSVEANHIVVIDESFEVEIRPIGIH